MPFEFQPYRSDLTGTIAELMMAGPRAHAAAAREAGAARQRAAEDSARITSQLVGSLGDIASRTGNQILQYQQDAPRREMEQLQLNAARTDAASGDARAKQDAWLRQAFSSETPPSPEQLVAGIGPERALPLINGLKALHSDPAKDYDSTQKVVRDVLAGMDALPEDLRQQAYPGVRQGLIAKRVITEADAPEQYDAAWFARVRNYGREPEKVGTREVKIRQPDGSETTQIVEDKPGQSFTSAAAPQKRSYQAKEVQVNGRQMMANFDTESGKFFDPASGQELAGVKPIPPQGPAGGEPLEAVVGPDGKSVLVPRSQARGMTPATNREKPTEDERKSAGFYKQMRDAITTLDALEDQLSEKELYQIQSLPQEGLVGLMNRGELSDGAKRYVRAFEQFTEARLRPVSGAAISDSEFARDRRTYAKQFKETADLNADRRRAREIALESLRQRAGVLTPTLSGETQDTRDTPKETGAAPGQFSVKAPDGNTYSFPSKGALEAFKARAGIK